MAQQQNHDDHSAQPHDHADDHGHDHDESHSGGVFGWLGAIFHLRGHHDQKSSLASDAAFTATEEGIRTVWLALAALTITTILQIIIVYWSGSVALLADTVHNLGDALNSIPLLIAFYLARRAPTRRYTYGFGRAEDVAGIFIVLSIAISAGVIFYESFRKLLAPEPMTNLGWVAVAAIIGFLGNEAVALLQIRTGKRINSAAMIADGQHARTDGFTSLAVLIAAGATWLGYPIVDPLVGIVIGITILFITWDAMKQVWFRLMDAADPELVASVEKTASSVQGVQATNSVRVRWIGHTLHTDLRVIVDEDLSTRVSHEIATEVRHQLTHALPQLASIDIHVDPCGHGGHDPHSVISHHGTPQQQPLAP